MKTETQYKQLFVHLPEQQAPHDLGDKVMVRIEHTHIVRMRIRGTIHGTIVIASIIGFIPTVQYISAQTSASGFADYASLFLSDTSYAFAHLKTVVLPLAESMPVLDIALALGIILVFGNSLKRSLSSLSTLSSLQSHTHNTIHI